MHTLDQIRSTTRLTTHRVAAVATATVLGLALAGCGSSASTPSAAGSSATAAGASGVAAQHNATDVTFINGMTPHHSGAIAMAQLAATRAGSTQVKDLAARIAGAQTPEQQRMAAMAAAWGVPAPSTDAAGGMGGMNHSGGTAAPMGGDDVAALTPLTGVAFDREFLTRMTDHHKSALPMAKAELDGGTNPQARQLAQEITDTQTREITEMAGLRKAL